MPESGIESCHTKSVSPCTCTRYVCWSIYRFLCIFHHLRPPRVVWTLSEAVDVERPQSTNQQTNKRMNESRIRYWFGPIVVEKTDKMDVGGACPAWWCSLWRELGLECGDLISAIRFRESRGALQLVGSLTFVSAANEVAAGSSWSARRFLVRRMSFDQQERILIMDTTGEHRKFKRWNIMYTLEVAVVNHSSCNERRNYGMEQGSIAIFSCPPLYVLRSFV